MIDKGAQFTMLFSAQHEMCSLVSTFGRRLQDRLEEVTVSFYVQAKDTNNDGVSGPSAPRQNLKNLDYE